MIKITFLFEDHKDAHNCIVVEDLDNTSRETEIFDFDIISKSAGTKSRYTPTFPLFLINHLLFFTFINRDNFIDLSYLGNLTSSEGWNNAINAFNNATKKNYPELVIEKVRNKNYRIRFKNANKLIPSTSDNIIKWESNYYDPYLNPYWLRLPSKSHLLDYSIYKTEEALTARKAKWEYTRINGEAAEAVVDIKKELLPHIKINGDENTYVNLSSLITDIAPTLLDTSNSRRLLLFEGPFGSGKTCSIKHLVYNLSKKGIVAINADFKDLVRSGKTLYNWLFDFISMEQLSTPISAFKKLNLESAESDSFILIAIDSFDEVFPDEEDRELLIMQIEKMLSNLDHVIILLGMRNADAFLNSFGMNDLGILDIDFLKIKSCYFDASDTDDESLKRIIHNYPEAGSPFFINRFYNLPKKITDSEEFRSIRSYYDLLDIQRDYLIRKTAKNEITSHGAHPLIYTVVLPYLAYKAISKSPGLLISDINLIQIDDYLSNSFSSIQARYAESFKVNNAMIEWIDYFNSLTLSDRKDLLLATGELKATYGGLEFLHIAALQYYASIYAARIISSSSDNKEKTHVIRMCNSIKYTSSFDSEESLSLEGSRNMFFCFCLFRELISIRDENPSLSWLHKFDLLTFGLNIGSWGHYPVYAELDPMMESQANRCEIYRKKGNTLKNKSTPDFDTIFLMLKTIQNSIKKISPKEAQTYLINQEKYLEMIIGCILRNYYDAFDSRAFNKHTYWRTRKNSILDDFNRHELINKHEEMLAIVNHQDTNNHFDWESLSFGIPEIYYLTSSLGQLLCDKSIINIWLKNTNYPPELLLNLLIAIDEYYLRAWIYQPKEFNRIELFYKLAISYTKVMYNRSTFSKLDFDSQIIQMFWYRAEEIMARFEVVEDDRLLLGSWTMESSMARLAIRRYLEPALSCMKWSYKKIEHMSINDSLSSIKLDASQPSDIRPILPIREFIEKSPSEEPFITCLYISDMLEKGITSLVNQRSLSDITKQSSMLDRRVEDECVCLVNCINTAYLFLKEDSNCDNVSPEYYRMSINKLWFGLKNKYINCFDLLLDNKKRKEALTVINRCLSIFRSIVPNYEIAEYIDSGGIFRPIGS